MPSARTSLPSASVVMTSMVVLSMAVSTSPGLVAAGPGMFSAAGITATMPTGSFMRAAAAAAANTAAAPLMSLFIAPMFSAGLIDIPPLSNVIPLPTRAIGSFSWPGRQVLDHDQGGRLGAAAGHAQERAHLEAGDLVGAEDLDGQARPSRRPLRARPARIVGVMRFAGVLARSRAR